MTEQEQTEDKGKRNAAEARQRWKKQDAQRRAEGPKPKPPKRKYQTLEVKGVPVGMYRQLEVMARSSNLTVGQLALLGLETLLTGGPDGKPVVLPKWKDVLDR